MGDEVRDGGQFCSYRAIEPLLIALQKPINPLLKSLSQQKYAINTLNPSMSEYPSFCAT